MKKILLAGFFLANIVLFSSCQRDHCPAHGEAPAVESNVKNA